MINFSGCWIWLNWDEIAAFDFKILINFLPTSEQYSSRLQSTGFRPEIVKMCEHSTMSPKGEEANAQYNAFWRKKEYTKCLVLTNFSELFMLFEIAVKNQFPDFEDCAYEAPDDFTIFYPKFSWNRRVLKCVVKRRRK